MSNKKYKKKSFIQQIMTNRKKRKRIGAIALCLFVVLFVQMASAKGLDQTAQIALVIGEIEMKQGEKIPDLKANASCAEDQKGIVLDGASGYTVGDLVKDLNNGKGYKLECEVSGEKEGSYAVTFQMKPELKEDVEGRWKDIVFLTCVDGQLVVKNKVGNWDGDKFKKYDGTYVENEFVDSKGKIYYFGKDNKMVTGIQEIDSKTYYFSKKGVMLTDTWKKRKSGKSFFGSDGIMVKGWLEYEDNLYYFDEDGYMVTGKKQVGSSLCKFGEDGVLVSKESHIDPDMPMMALTFDDGPGERTGELLDDWQGC